MNTSFRGLSYGLIFAVVLVYLLMVVNFQSWMDPLIILMALPGAMTGILWMLFVTHTTINVPSLMGAIMAIGIAVANSILLVSFAERQRQEGMPLLEAVTDGAAGRLRAVLMTASAMIFGMMPMAIGASEGGAQAAPLGRAVIGGLIVSTFATLTILPSIYAILQSHVSTKAPSLNPMDPLSEYYDAGEFAGMEESVAIPESR
jgi:multidrug efflux pump subunit AcrB